MYKKLTSPTVLLATCVNGVASQMMQLQNMDQMGMIVPQGGVNLQMIRKGSDTDPSSTVTSSGLMSMENISSAKVADGIKSVRSASQSQFKPQSGQQLQSGPQSGHQLQSGPQSGHQLQSGPQPQSGQRLQSGQQLQSQWQPQSGQQVQSQWQPQSPQLQEAGQQQMQSSAVRFHPDSQSSQQHQCTKLKSILKNSSTNSAYAPFPQECLTADNYLVYGGQQQQQIGVYNQGQLVGVSDDQETSSLCSCVSSMGSVGSSSKSCMSMGSSSPASVKSCCCSKRPGETVVQTQLLQRGKVHTISAADSQKKHEPPRMELIKKEDGGYKVRLIVSKQKNERLVINAKTRVNPSITTPNVTCKYT